MRMLHRLRLRVYWKRLFMSRKGRVPLDGALTMIIIVVMTRQYAPASINCPTSSSALVPLLMSLWVMLISFPFPRAGTSAERDGDRRETDPDAADGQIVGSASRRHAQTPGTCLASVFAGGVKPFFVCLVLCELLIRGVGMGGWVCVCVCGGGGG